MHVTKGFWLVFKLLLIKIRYLLLAVIIVTYFLGEHTLKSGGFLLFRKSGERHNLATMRRWRLTGTVHLLRVLQLNYCGYSLIGLFNLTAFTISGRMLLLFAKDLSLNDWTLFIPLEAAVGV